MKSKRKKNCNDRGLKHDWRFVKEFPVPNGMVRYEKCGRCGETRHEKIEEK